MPTRQHTVVLPADERTRLTELLAGGVAPVRTVKHAQILLLADHGIVQKRWTDQAIGQAVGCARETVARLRAKYCRTGLEAALTRKPPDRVYRHKLDGEGEAMLLALACGPAPAGRAAWTLTLLAERLVELQIVDAIAPATVARTLKKTNCVPGGFARGA